MLNQRLSILLLYKVFGHIVYHQVVYKMLKNSKTWNAIRFYTTKRNHWNIYRHVTQFLKSVNTSLLNCPLRVGEKDFIKDDSIIFLSGIFSDALVKTTIKLTSNISN